MTPGELDQRVTLQSLTSTSDGQGGETVEWTDQATVWARVRPMSGREREQADGVQAEAGYLVIIRYRSDVNENWRVVWRGRAMNITFVRDGGPRRLYLPLECTRGVAT